MSTASPKDTPGTLPDAIRTFFTFPGPVALTLSAVAAWAGKLVVGGWSATDLLVGSLMIACWPLQEWLIHVFVLHAKPRKIGPWNWSPRNAIKHRAHHADPWRLDLVFIPWFVWAPAIPLLWLGLPALLPLELALTVLAVYFTFSSHYEWSHYIAHIRWRPRSKHYRHIVDAHRWHHFKNESRWWGVSMTMADRVLGTSGTPETVPHSDTVRTLGIDGAAAGS